MGFRYGDNRPTNMSRNENKAQKVYIGHGAYKNVSWANQNYSGSNYSKTSLLQEEEEHNLRLDDVENDHIAVSVNSEKDSPFIIDKSFAINLPSDVTVILHCWYFLLIVMSLVVIGTMFLSAGGTDRTDSSYVPLFDCVLNQTSIVNGITNSSISTPSYEDNKMKVLTGYSVFSGLLTFGMLLMRFIKICLKERLSIRTRDISTSIIHFFLWIIIIIFEIFSIHYAIFFYCYSHLFNALVGLSIAGALPVISPLVILFVGCLRCLFNPTNYQKHNEYATIP